MSINAADINAQLLPRMLRELAECIGLEATLKLAQAYPGVSVYVPSNPEPNHALVAVIGYEALRKLAAAYGQEHLRLPKVDAATRQIKHAMVRELRKQNMSNRAIALRTGYTQRRVEQLNSEAPDDTQPDFFNR